MHPSVIENARLFDMHMSNSRPALATCRSNGLAYTFLMLFAVYLGPILKELAPNPAFDLDIICLGHAAGRPERVKTMVALIDSFSSVRTYVKDWPFEGAQKVKGRDVMHASRGVRLHINFPLTLAGHTNLKCGVFESIGSGAVLLTHRFDEMADYFDYSSEIIEYNDCHDLISKIRILLSNPDEVERIRRRGFARLARMHLYERCWLEVFSRLIRWATD